MADENQESTLTLFVGRYPNVVDATCDFDLIWEDRSEKFTTTFDAAVVERDAEGDVHVVKKVEVPARMGGWTGFLVGAALAVVFPPAVVTIPATAALGALAGHFARGMSREDVRAIGELLEESCAALVVVVASSHADGVRTRIGRAERLEERELPASARELDIALNDIATAEPEGPAE